MTSLLDRWFGVDAAGSDVATELRGGLTTFVTMAYIVVVNADILSASGIPFEAAVFATCAAAAVGSALMAWWAGYPFALAPGMGINAYFAFVVVPAVAAVVGPEAADDAWRIALGLVGWEGLLFLLATGFGMRTRIMEAIPAALKISVGAGIGLFIALIGLQRAGVVVDDPVTLLDLGNLRSSQAALAAIGLLVTGAMVMRGVRGALLWGILVTTGLAGLAGEVGPPARWMAWPGAGATLQWDLFGALDWRFVDVLVALLFVDLFDTVGTLTGVAVIGGFLDDDGNLPRARGALAADAAATVTGAALGTSTVTTYVESASGVSEGARTGLANVVVVLGFLAVMPLAPALEAIPDFATTPVLVVVGSLMARSLGQIDWDRRADSLAAFVTTLAIPATYSIGDGLAMGVLTWVGVKLLGGEARQIHPVMWVLAVLFFLRYLLLPS